LSNISMSRRVKQYLLKGHEDLRQDERVMQLFGLVNTLLQNDRESARRDLQIVRYSVIPLEPNSVRQKRRETAKRAQSKSSTNASAPQGLIEWVPDCDTLHALVKEYRETRKILLNIEHRLMLAMAPEYDQLPLMGKVEVFQHALANTTGQDLNKVLWLKSQNSEDWLQRRSNYTRSLALMSIVGYILGLGDRHPSNLMLHRFSGKLVHVDFGDCFEVAQKSSVKEPCKRAL
jgi:FKBP12-rapamycin complex-associated protein